MLIPLKSFLQKHKLNVSGVLHIGAHWAEEQPEYEACGVKNVIYIEPCADAFKKLQGMFEGNKSVTLFQCACADYTGQAEMNVSDNNQGQSNSLLKPKLHLQQHPEVVFDKKELVDVRRIDDLPFDRSLYNLMNLDIQGAEFFALVGARETLKHIDIVYSEVNKGETYENNPLIEELDKLLSDFTRVQTEWAGNTSWGDGIWVRNRKASPTIEVENNQIMEAPSIKHEEASNLFLDDGSIETAFKKAGVWEELCKAGLQNKVSYIAEAFAKQKTNARLEKLKQDAITKYRIDISHLL